MNLFAGIYYIKRVLINSLFLKYFKTKNKSNLNTKKNFKDLLGKSSKGNKSKNFKAHIYKH